MKAVVKGHYFDSNEATEIAGSFYASKYGTTQKNLIIYYMPREDEFFEYNEYHEYLPPHYTHTKIKECVELITQKEILDLIKIPLFDSYGRDKFYGGVTILNRKLKDELDEIGALIEIFNKTFDNYGSRFDVCEDDCEDDCKDDRESIIITMLRHYLERNYSQDWILCEETIFEYIESLVRASELKRVKELSPF